VLPLQLRGERGVGLREFLEGKARNLGDDVINARLEARGVFARDVVLEFVEQVLITMAQQSLSAKSSSTMQSAGMLSRTAV
jgi:hypothetical protein